MPTAISAITKSPNVCGGVARIRDTRVPVWSIVNYRRQGASEGAILKAYPSLTAADLEAAFDYAAQNANEIERAIWRNETVMIERRQNANLSPIIRRGRELGLTDEEIRDSFEPPLSLAAFESALAERRAS